MNKKYEILINLGCSLCMVFLMLCLFPIISLSQSRLDIPTANLEIRNAVPLNLVEKIARVKTGETWGKGALGEPIPLRDLNGNVIAYMFSFHIGEESFPTYEEILQKIKKGRELRNYVKDSQIEKAKEMYKILKQESAKSAGNNAPSNSNRVISPSEPQPQQIEPVRPDGSISRRIEVGEIREIEKFAAKKAIGVGEFGTIIVSATYNMFPVPAYLHYLAPYYFNFDLALEKAKQIIGQGAFLERIYFLGLDGQYFEFVNNSSNILINCKTLETKDIEEVRKLRGPGLQPPLETSILQEAKSKLDEEIVKAWGKIKAEVGN